MYVMIVRSLRDTYIYIYIFINVYIHLQSSKTCKDSCDESCFKVIDSAKTDNQLKVKEDLHILWEGPNLNRQVQHYNFSLSF